MLCSYEFYGVLMFFVYNVFDKRDQVVLRLLFNIYDATDSDNITIKCYVVCFFYLSFWWEIMRIEIDVVIVVVGLDDHRCYKRDQVVLRLFFIMLLILIMSILDAILLWILWGVFVSCFLSFWWGIIRIEIDVVGLDDHRLYKRDQVV